MAENRLLKMEPNATFADGAMKKLLFETRISYTGFKIPCLKLLLLLPISSIELPMRAKRILSSLAATALVIQTDGCKRQQTQADGYSSTGTQPPDRNIDRRAEELQILEVGADLVLFVDSEQLMILKGGDPKLRRYGFKAADLDEFAKSIGNQRELAIIKTPEERLLLKGAGKQFVDPVQTNIDLIEPLLRKVGFKQTIVQTMKWGRDIDITSTNREASAAR